MKHLKIFFAVLAMLSASRFIPHPPNFTSLLALSFYIPLVFGSRYILAVIISLLITDMVIGFHSTMFFTLGSVFIIGIISKSFKKTIFSRLSGALSGAIIFFILMVSLQPKINSINATRPFKIKSKRTHSD